MHYDFVKFIHHAACFLTSICAIHVGLKALGYNVYNMVPVLAPHALYIDYIFGIAGVVSFVFLVMHSVLCACGSACCARCVNGKK